MRKSVFIFLLALIATLAACTDDESFSTSRANLLTFATDTVKMDTVFSKVPAPTKSFWIYNNSSDGIRCSQIKLEKGNQTGFRVNVDGDFLSAERGYLLNDIEIRKGDSLRVFVEVTTPMQGQFDPKLVEDNLVFNLESGATQKVNLNAWSWDAEKITNLKVTGRQTLNGKRPIVVYGGITVDSTAVLTIDPGTTIYFHGDAGINVYGKLFSEGTPEEPVTLRGDRLDRMFDYLPYDLVSGQWKGIRFHSSSLDNELTFTDLHSACDGIVCDSSSLNSVKLYLQYSTVHNCQGYGVKSNHSVIALAGSQITNTLHDCVSLNGGYAEIINCTLAQFYPFDSNRGVALRFSDEMNDKSKISFVGANGLTCANTIVTGFADDVVMGEMNDTTGTYTYYFENNVMRTPQVKGDSVHFVNIIWEKELEDSLAEANKKQKNNIKLRQASNYLKKAQTAEEGMFTFADSTKTGEKMFVLVSHDTQHYDFHLDSLACAVGRASKKFIIPNDRDGKTYNLNKPDIGCYSLSTLQKSYTKNYLRRRRF